MNGLIWNCRGAGSRNFPATIKDLMRIYHLDYIALLEPRVSGTRADDIIRRTGLVEVARIDARGFSSGVWCLWRPPCPPIQVISVSAHCIHLCVNFSSPNCWFFSVVYASPQRNEREQVWQELCQVRETIDGSWCLAGDFNQVLYDYEKEGGVPLGSSAATSFADCINTCQLLDLGFKGQQFTWKRGDLKERLDRVLCTTDWQAMYPNCSVTYLPLVGSDHCGLWLRTSTRRVPNGSYFKFLAPWIDHPDFVNQVSSSWIESDS